MRSRTAFLKRVRWAMLWRSDVLLIRFCRVFGIRMNKDSFWHPLRLLRFRPYYRPSPIVMGVRLASKPPR